MSIRREPCGHRCPNPLRLFHVTRWLWHVQHKRICRLDRRLRKTDEKPR